MITSKFYTDIPKEVLPYIDKFNVVCRVGYNRLCDGMSLSEAEWYVKDHINNIDILDTAMIKFAVNKAKSLVSKEHVVVFGGRKNLAKRRTNKITKEQWHELRNASMLLRGSSSDGCGNRKAKLDIANNQILFKPTRYITIPIKLPHLSNKTRNDLTILQNKCELKEACFSLEITRNSVHIIYDEAIVKENYKQIKALPDRILSIDMNPNYIGVAVLDKDLIIHKELIDLTDSNKLSSTNKRKHWLVECAKHIVGLAAHYRANIAIEDLNIKSKNHGKGKTFNRLVNNQWNRVLLANNLKKRCNLAGIKCVEIYCAYSSFVGQMLNEQDYDSIAAAIEVGHRGLQKLAKKKYNVLPKKLDLSMLPTRWKEEATANGIKTWAEFYNFLKKSKISYRYLFTRDKFVGVSFKLKSCRSCILVHDCVG